MAVGKIRTKEREMAELTGMSKQAAIKLLTSIKNEMDVSVTIHSVGNVPIDPPEEPKDPDTRLVDVVSGHAFHNWYKNNESGYPIMEPAGVGKAEEGTRWSVEVDRVVGDGSTRYWWRIWLGMEEDKTRRGLYLRGDKCVKVG
jgi:hypothetical protein